MERVLTPAQMSDAEKASEKLGVSLGQLMDNAGTALAWHTALAAREIGAESVMLLCGSGNNGGDGFVCARILNEKGFDVSVKMLCGMPKTPLAKDRFERMTESCGEGIVDDERQSADILIDCVFGTGFHGQLPENIINEFDNAQRGAKLIIACDMPSGIDCMSGLVSNGTLKCGMTVTFHAQKLGMALKPAKGFCGRVITCDIGIPDGWQQLLSDPAEIYSVKEGDIPLPERADHSHKGTFGTALIAAGSRQYIGAAVICSRAALRSGCGIVRLAAPEIAVTAAAVTSPECVYDILSDDDKESCARLAELAGKASAALIGCGLGCTDRTKLMLESMIKNTKNTLVIDADGINCLAEHIDMLKDKNSEIVLTPHIGELARLCGCTVQQAVSGRYALCRGLCEKYGVIVHSKDSTSMTFYSDKVYITDFGNSALAKGGSGDMLAGVIVSLAAQGVLPAEACLLADMIVGISAKRLSRRFSPAYITAADIIAAFGETLAQLQ